MQSVTPSLRLAQTVAFGVFHHPDQGEYLTKAALFRAQTHSLDIRI